LVLVNRYDFRDSSDLLRNITGGRHLSRQVPATLSHWAFIVDAHWVFGPDAVQGNYRTSRNALDDSETYPETEHDNESDINFVLQNHRRRDEQLIAG
jgi:hypothetical protein